MGERIYFSLLRCRRRPRKCHVLIDFQMALTFQQIILDAGKLVNEISTQENTADVLICEIQNVCSQIDSMKQVSVAAVFAECVCVCVCERERERERGRERWWVVGSFWRYNSQYRPSMSFAYVGFIDLVSLLYIC